MVLFKLHEKRYEILRATSDLRTTGVRMKFQYGNGDSPLDGYVIRRGIGVGGFGEVYFAESDSGKEVALKRIQKNLDVEMRGVRHCLN
jgi:serine/threonine protein kinase